MSDCTTEQKNILGSNNDSTNWTLWSQNQRLNMNGSANDIDAAESNIAAMIKCLQSLRTDTSSLPTQIENLRQETVTLEETLATRQEEVDIARRRVEKLRHPARDVSYYQGWFPIDRPLRHETIPILMGFSILFFTFFIGFILSSMGLTIGLDTSKLFQVPVVGFLTQLQPIFWLTVILLLIVTIVAVNIIRAK